MKTTANDWKWQNSRSEFVVAEAYRLHAIGKADEAVALLTADLERMPENPWISATAGDILYLQGRFSEAIEYLSRALDGHPRSAYTWALRGDCHRQRLRPRSALADYERAWFFGLRDVDRRKEVCDQIMDLYSFFLAGSDSENVAFQEKLRDYGVWRQSLNSDIRTGMHRGEKVDFLMGSAWVPSVAFGSVRFGVLVNRVVLQNVYLAASASEVWRSFESSCGLVIFTRSGIVQNVRVAATLHFQGQDLIGCRRDELEELLGPASSEEVQDQDQKTILTFRLLGAEFSLLEGVVQSALLS